MEIETERIYQPPLPDLGSALSMVGDLPGFLHRSIDEKVGLAERACYDRYLRILNALELRSAFGSSLLDLGCANGFFAYLLTIHLCSRATAVEDTRGSTAGYGKSAFLEPLREAQRQYGLEQLEIVEQPIETFLASQPERRWDVVLCLSVLHHLYTGYGDRPEVGRMEAGERRRLFEAIGRATSSVLYLEFDHGRVPDDFLDDFASAGGFAHCQTLGSSSSAVGDLRNIYELTK